MTPWPLVVLAGAAIGKQDQPNQVQDNHRLPDRRTREHDQRPRSHDRILSRVLVRAPGILATGLFFDYAGELVVADLFEGDVLED